MSCKKGFEPYDNDYYDGENGWIVGGSKRQHVLCVCEKQLECFRLQEKGGCCWFSSLDNIMLECIRIVGGGMFVEWMDGGGLLGKG